MRVIDAGQQVDAGRTRSAQFAAVAAPCCCTWLATLTIQCQPHWAAHWLWQDGTGRWELVMGL